MFEKDLQATNWNDSEVPAIFTAIAEAAEDVTAVDVRDAVLAAFMACPDDATPEARRSMYRKLLVNIVEDYAVEVGLPVDIVCDALVGAAQASEPIKVELRRRRITT